MTSNMEQSEQFENYADNGLMTRDEFVKLYNFINVNEVILNKVKRLNSEEVVIEFNSSVQALSEENNEIVEDTKLNFLFYVLRNSIILNLEEDVKTQLQPLSNLALSIDMLDGLKSLLETNVQLENFVLSDIDHQHYILFSQVIENCKEKRELFLQDTFKAEQMVLFYHTLRNKIVGIITEKLSTFMSNFQKQPFLADALHLDGKSLFFMKTLNSLDWNQQVIACEALEFNLPFTDAFQAYLLKSPKKPKPVKIENAPSTTKPVNHVQPSYYKSTKIHCCNFCDYGTKKLSNIKNHLRGKHRKIILPPGNTGFTTQNENGEILNYVPRKRKKNKNSTKDKVEDEVPEEPDNSVRYHQCNFCSYTTEKMSNMKSHIKSVHRFVNSMFGFVTQYRPKIGSGDSEEHHHEQGRTVDVQFPDDLEYPYSGEADYQFPEEEDGPSVEDFLECKMELHGEKEEEECPDDDGIGDNNEDASVHIINSLYNTSPVPAPGRIRRRHGKTRIQQCNFCNYTSKKMSNIKMHVKNVHKRIERGPDDTGFTTVFI